MSANPYDKWRIFQLIFLVNLIPDLIDNSKRRDVCEVLHVPTGGGKSEAYFGCVLFAAFFDRLSGKEFGVTAITKFPLRMLSIQQLQRISNLFIWARKIRLEEKIPGEPFSLGYFVGSTDEFPRNSDKIVKKINKAKELGEEIKGVIIDKCPICSKDDPGNVILDINENYHIIHKCNK
jgi:hypothetical protein